MAIKKTFKGDKVSQSVYKTEVAWNEDEIEITLRPQSLEDYIWQHQLKANLRIFIDAAKKRWENLEHMLFYWPPWLGKTTLSMIIAREMGSNLRTTSWPAIEKAGDLAAIITNLKEWDVLFIDEIHRLRPNIEEILYSAMEDQKLDIIIWKWPWARSMSIKLPSFTLIWATTKLSSVSSPLRDRFGNISRLEFYSVEDIEKILDRSAKILEIDIERKALKKISACCRSVPRIANRLLKRLRDFAQINNEWSLSHSLSELWLKALWIDENWLDHIDKFFLETLINKFNWWPVWLSTLAVSISEEADTIENVYEPFLIQLWFLKRTSKWRVATRNAYEYLWIAFDDSINS